MSRRTTPHPAPLSAPPRSGGAAGSPGGGSTPPDPNCSVQFLSFRPDPGPRGNHVRAHVPGPPPGPHHHTRPARRQCGRRPGTATRGRSTGRPGRLRPPVPDPDRAQGVRPPRLRRRGPAHRLAASRRGPLHRQRPVAPRPLLLHPHRRLPRPPHRRRNDPSERTPARPHRIRRPLDHSFVMHDLTLTLDPAHLHVGTAPAALTIDVTCSDITRRRGRAASLRYTSTLRRDGHILARADASCTCTPPPSTNACAATAPTPPPRPHRTHRTPDRRPHLPTDVVLTPTPTPTPGNYAPTPATPSSSTTRRPHPRHGPPRSRPPSHHRPPRPPHPPPSPSPPPSPTTPNSTPPATSKPTPPPPPPPATTPPTSPATKTTTPSSTPPSPPPPLTTPNTPRHPQHTAPGTPRHRHHPAGPTHPQPTPPAPPHHTPARPRQHTAPHTPAHPQTSPTPSTSTRAHGHQLSSRAPPPNGHTAPHQDHGPVHAGLAGDHADRPVGCTTRCGRRPRVEGVLVGMGGADPGHKERE